jgi:hypothetical protein
VSDPAEELLDETFEDGQRLRLVRRAGLCEVWRGDALLFGEARRREDRAFAEFALAPLGGRDDPRSRSRALARASSCGQSSTYPGCARSR